MADIEKGGVMALPACVTRIGQVEAPRLLLAVQAQGKLQDAGEQEGDAAWFGCRGGCRGSAAIKLRVAKVIGLEIGIWIDLVIA